MHFTRDPTRDPTRDTAMTAESQVLPHVPAYVGFWARVAATIVDTILLAVVLTPLTMVVFGRTSSDVDNGPAHFVISVLIPAMAVVIFWVRRQATPGKILVHARIVDARTGSAPRTGQLLLRYVGYYVSGIALGLGFLWVAFDARKQGWHDKMAGTVVVRDDAPNERF